MGALTQNMLLDLQNIPILSCSVTLCVRALDNKQNLTKLERVQALAWRVMAGSEVHLLTHLIAWQKLLALAATSEEKQSREQLQGYIDYTLLHQQQFPE